MCASDLSVDVLHVTKRSAASSTIDSVCRTNPEARLFAVRYLTRDCIPNPQSRRAVNTLGPAACCIRMAPRQPVSEQATARESERLKSATEERRRRTTYKHANRSKVAVRKALTTGGRVHVKTFKTRTTDRGQNDECGVIRLWLGVCLEELQSIVWTTLTNGSESKRGMSKFNLQ